MVSRSKSSRQPILPPLSPLGRLAPRRQLVAYGTSERVDLVDGNRRYCARARELGDDVEELVLRGADHFSVIDPRTLAWQAIAREVERIFPARRRSASSRRSPKRSTR